jgi:hypothetical protein
MKVHSDDDANLVIVLRRNEAKKLRKILDTKVHKVPPKTPFDDAPFRNKLDLALEMLGVKRA